MFSSRKACLVALVLSCAGAEETCSSDAQVDLPKEGQQLLQASIKPAFVEEAVEVSDGADASGKNQFLGCYKQTGGTCRLGWCDDWRKADCRDKRCVCAGTKCAVNGKCIEYSETSDGKSKKNSMDSLKKVLQEKSAKSSTAAAAKADAEAKAAQIQASGQEKMKAAVDARETASKHHADALARAQEAKQKAVTAQQAADEASASVADQIQKYHDQQDATLEAEAANKIHALEHATANLEKEAAAAEAADKQEAARLAESHHSAREAEHKAATSKLSVSEAQASADSAELQEAIEANAMAKAAAEAAAAAEEAATVKAQAAEVKSDDAAQLYELARENLATLSSPDVLAALEKQALATRLATDAAEAEAAAAAKATLAAKAAADAAAVERVHSTKVSTAQSAVNVANERHIAAAHAKAAAVSQESIARQLWTKTFELAGGEHICYKDSCGRNRRDAGRGPDKCCFWGKDKCTICVR